MSAITTHVLDTARGRPAAGVEIRLSRRQPDGSWFQLGTSRTDGDGRVADLLPSGEPIGPGTYRLRFELREYFDSVSLESFYPFAEVAFEVGEPAAHYHVPLLVSPYGYCTYRGS
ncbi:MAG: hydroxyisourate hydrolase [Gemmatimonadota bacterium]